MQDYERKNHQEYIDTLQALENDAFRAPEEWKVPIVPSCPVGYYKHFVVCLKKMRDDGQIAMRAGKFHLLMGFKLEMLMVLENGKSGKKVATSSVSLKPGAKKTAAKKGKGAAKKAQIERKAAAVAVKGKAGKIASA